MKDFLIVLLLLSPFIIKYSFKAIFYYKVWKHIKKK